MSLDYYTPDVAPQNCSEMMFELVLSEAKFASAYGQTLYYICSIVDVWLVQEKYSSPMVWIGIYIAVASLLCILAMTADLLHGFRNKKFWFPCKYFTLNAASITVITVAMKLPVDLSSEMPHYMDQAAKLGSLAFMCTMMVNLMPSLASMDNKTLAANVIGLSILVITMIVNICIQIDTGAIKHQNLHLLDAYTSGFDCVVVAYIYITIIMLLLIILISSSLIIPTTKEILEFKYQVTNKASISNQRLQHTQTSTVDKLRQHVRRYWVMAETGSPQFVMASNPLSTACGVICVFVSIINLIVMLEIPYGFHGEDATYRSSYKKSILFIVVAQSIGVVVGIIAPIFRSFSVFSFKLVTKWNWNHLMIFKLEKYWTQKLYEWKERHVHFLSSIPSSRFLAYNLKNIFLNLCIGLQKVIVVSCKVIWLIAIVIPILIVKCLYYWKLLKARLFTQPITSRSDDLNDDLSNYVLHINGEMELAEKTLKGISKSMDFLILKAEKEQNNYLLKLLKKSTGFKGVENFDSDHVQPLFSLEHVNSWSLPIVTLTCIALALPGICEDMAKSLLTSVGEGLFYTHTVEESLNITSEYINIRKATISLWHEVEYKAKWLDISLTDKHFKGKTAKEILEWFADEAKKSVIEIKESTNGDKVENTTKELVSAISMYRITQTILLRYQSNKDQITKKKLFAIVEGMIADILSACFTNIPRVIEMKCHESVIEKRQVSVKAAAELLGKTTKIIERLDTCEFPRMDHDKVAYIDEWRLYLKQSIP